GIRDRTVTGVQTCALPIFLALYSRGMSTRDIEAHLRELYGVSVGRDLISRVTDAVLEDVKAWQQRPLDDVYPVLFLDAFVVKVRSEERRVGKECRVGGWAA